VALPLVVWAGEVARQWEERDAAEEPPPEAEARAVAAEPRLEAVGRGAVEVGALLRAVPGGRCCLRRFFRRLLGLSVGTGFFLRRGLRHDQRRCLRVRLHASELHCRKSGRGKQRETKFCHDDLGSRKNLGNKCWRSTNKG
jgi:hypothetical protein